jgi:cystatin-A/B
MMGGHSAYKQPNAEELEFFLLQRAAIEAAAGHAFQHFEVVHFTHQVVAGTIYQVKIKVADGEHIHVKIFKPLPHTGQPAQVQVVTTGHAHDAPFNF